MRYHVLEFLVALFALVHAAHGLGTAEVSGEMVYVLINDSIRLLIPLAHLITELAAFNF